MPRIAAFGIVCCTVLLAVVVPTGCEEGAEPPEITSDTPVAIGGEFDAATAGELRGQVTWRGAIPDVPTYRAPVSPGTEHAGQTRRFWPNPHAPHIDPLSKGVAGAVVYLRGIDPRRSRPWDHPPVRAELRDYQIHICQGDREHNTGFVRRGEAIEMVSRQALYHALQVRGAAFFARAFPDTDHPCRQRLDRAGIVELSSGCGYFWMRGWLFVAEHPYYARTDAKGHFALPQVPPGDYELVCWLPDWHEAFRELDAETALICRLTFRPPVEIVQPVQIAPRQSRTVELSFDADRFGR